MARREWKLIFGTNFRFCDHLTRSRQAATGPIPVIPSRNQRVASFGPVADWRLSSGIVAIADVRDEQLSNAESGPVADWQVSSGLKAMRKFVSNVTKQQRP